jgi:hypothetical protein
MPMTGRLARHAVVEVDDSRAEGAGLDEFEIHPALALGKERNATADSVLENTTFGSGFQIAAHSSIESSSDGSWSAVS